MGRSTISNRRTSSNSSRNTRTRHSFRGVRNSSFDDLKVSSKIKNHISKIKKHNVAVFQKTQIQELIEKLILIVQVKLGTKTKSLFGSKSGERFTAEMIGFLPEAGAYIVKDTRDNDMFIVPRRMILDKVIVDPKPVHRRNRFGFQFQLNSDVPFTIGLTAEGIHDSNGDLMDGQIVRAKVIYHIRDSGTKWYVLQVEAPHYDESDPDNWWSGFDIRREDCVR